MNYRVVTGAFHELITVSLWRRLLRALASMLPMVLLGCSSLPMTSGLARADEVVDPDAPAADTEPAAPVTPITPVSPEERVTPAELAADTAPVTPASPADHGQLMFEIMIAELASRRGQLDIALTGYLRAAEHSTDVRVADRATRLALYARQWPEAEQAARRWLQLDDSAEEARATLSQTLLIQGKSEEAGSVLQTLVERSDDRGASLTRIQAELQQLPDSDAARAIMESLAVRFSEEPAAHLGVAGFALRARDSEQALSAVEAALALAPDDTRALLMQAQIRSDAGQAGEGFPELDQALDAAPDNTQLRLGRSQLLVETGRYAQAAEDLKYLFEARQDDTEVLLTISLLALDSRRLDDAERYLQRLLVLGGYPEQTHFYLARINDQRKDYQQAIELYDAVQQGELYVTARIRAAELVALTGGLAEGRERLQVLSQQIDDPALQPRLLVAEGRMLQDAGEDESALKFLGDALEQFPDNGRLLYARALAAQSSGDAEMMERDLETLITAEPENAQALNALGYYLADENLRLDKAAAYLEKANDLEPDDAAILDSLGWLRYRQQDYSAALELLQRAYDLYPDAEIAAHLGEVLWQKGSQQEARELWKKALLESPEHEKLQEVMQRFMPR